MNILHMSNAVVESTLYICICEIHFSILLYMTICFSIYRQAKSTIPLAHSYNSDTKYAII